MTPLEKEFSKCLCSISFTRAGHDYYDMALDQKQSEARSGATAMERAREIWRDNPDKHEGLRATFQELGPLATMDEIERE